MLGLLAYVLGWSSFFTVTTVEISGTKNPIVTGIVPGQKLARVEPRAVVAGIEKINWVESAQLSRNWINGHVNVAIVERTPVATFNNVVIDSHGKSFSPQQGMPSQLIALEASTLESAVGAVSFLGELPKEFKDQIVTVKVRQSGSLVLITANNGKNLEIRWGANSENQLKYKVYVALISLPENSLIKRVDVSAPHAPIVK